jgi:hypothetical protein
MAERSASDLAFAWRHCGLAREENLLSKKGISRKDGKPPRFAKISFSISTSIVKHDRFLLSLIT